MVTHDIKNHKFKIESLKGLSCLEYDLTGHVFTVLHTIVPMTAWMKRHER